MTCIYELINSINGKKYVGQTKDLNSRLNKHKTRAREGNQLPLYNAIRKYGFDAFEVKILREFSEEESKDQSLVDAEEIRLIKEEQSHWTENGYNIERGGIGGNGRSIQKILKNGEEK